VSDFVKKYQEKAIGCPCHGWARCDAPSGFLSLHHAGCVNFDSLAELHIFNRKVMKDWARIKQLEKALRDLRDRRDWANIEDVDDFIDKALGEDKLSTGNK